MCVMVIREMNKRAEIIVHTPVGDTKEIICEDKELSMSVPQLRGVSTGKINDVGKGVVMCMVQTW